MNKCKFCENELPVMRVQRSWTEKHFNHRNEFKYQCNNCYKITFKKSKISL